MKTSSLYLVLLAGAFGVLAGSTSLSAANNALPTVAMPMAAEVNTNATPDLLTTCPVTGEKLGDMGKPFTFVYQKQEVKLCCKGCKKDFDKEPEKYLKLIRAADKTDKK